MALVDLRLGDCREVMKTIGSDSIDSIVTDPPYELGFMGKKWDGTGIAYDIEMWAECLRILKPGGYLLAFSGSRTYHRMACAIEDAGFDIRDQIMWLYSQGFPKSHNLEGEWEGWGTALKPAHEPICVARKKLAGTIADNTLEYGTGAINIDECRIGYENDKDNPDILGRWPANIIHDGSDEVMAAFPDADGQQGDLVDHSKDRKSKGIFNDMGAARNHLKRNDVGSAARFFYCAKASKEDRDEGLDTLAKKQYSHDGRKKAIENAYQRNASMARNHHPTVKPTELMRYLCRLVTRPDGLVLDPFMGSGSTGKAACLERLNFIGIEQDAEYLKIASKRINYVTKQGILI